MKKLTAVPLALLSALTVLSLAALPAAALIPTEAVDLPEGGLYFPFDGNAEEASGALTGRLRGDPRFVEGRDGTPEGAIYFAAEEDSVVLGIDDVEGSWTASFWVKSAGGQTYHAFLCSGMTGSLRMIQDDGMVGATMNGVVDRSVPYAVPPDEWTMLTFAYDDSIECTSVYVNGEFFDGMLGLQTLSLTLLGNDAPEQKGWQSAPGYALDDTRFFGRLLSEEEIRVLYETNEVPDRPVPEEDPAQAPEEVPADPEDAENPENPEEAEEAEEEVLEELPEAEAVREKKPGAFVAMGGILLAALFLVAAGLRALFGRRSK